MTKAVLIVPIILISWLSGEAMAGPSGGSGAPVKDGDIIFQRSLSRQSYAIAAATKSEFTHMGIIFFHQGEPLVAEAIDLVQATPLNDWIARGKSGEATVMRLKDSSKLDIDRMKAVFRTMQGKRYDYHFDWSDQRIYCSELVWKIYKEACGIELAPLRELQDFDLTKPVVKDLMSERYGKDIPFDMKVVAPIDLYHSKLLKKVR